MRQKYFQIHVSKTYLVLILAIRPVLFTPNVQIQLETSSLQRVKKCPKTTRHFQMNAAKNWALTIMLKALAFIHFLSELLLKEQMIIPVKRNVYQRWSYRRKIDQFQRNLPKKIQRNRLFFTDCFLTKFPPEISREIGRFS